MIPSSLHNGLKVDSLAVTWESDPQAFEFCSFDRKSFSVNFCTYKRLGTSSCTQGTCV